MTLEELITGTSKLPNYLTHCRDLDFENSVIDALEIFNKLEKIEDGAASTQDSHFTNFYILTKLLEEFTNRTYKELFDYLYKNSIGLQSTHLHTGSNHEIADLYLPACNVKINMDNLAGTANIISSPSDIIEFYEHIFHTNSNAANLVRDIFYKEEAGVLLKDATTQYIDMNPNNRTIEHDVYKNTKNYAEESDFGGHHIKIYHFAHSMEEQDYILILNFHDTHSFPKVDQEIETPL